MGPSTHSSASQSTRRPRPPSASSRATMSARRRLTSPESSQVRDGRFAQPERHRRRLPSSVLHAQHAPPRLDAPDAPRVRAEDEDVAGHALDGPVLVDGAHRRLVGIEHHAVVGDVGDGAAVGGGHDARGLAPAEHAVHAIAMHERAGATQARGGSLGDAGHHVVEGCSREVREGRRGANQGEERVLGPFARGALGDDLLRQDVERRHRRVHAIEASGGHRAHQRRALHQLVARGGEEAPARGASRGRALIDRCAGGTSSPRAASRSGRPRSTVPTSMPSSSEAVATSARISPGLQALLDAQAAIPGQAAVVRADALLAQPLAQVVRHALGHAPGVDEDQRGAVRADQDGQAVVDLGPLLVRGHRFEIGARELDGEVEIAAVPDVDDGTRAARCRRESARPRRWGARWRRGRCAAGACRPGHRDGPARGPGGCRACRA